MAYTPHATALILNFFVGGVPKAEPIPGYLMFDGVDGQVEVPNPPYSAMGGLSAGERGVKC